MSMTKKEVQEQMARIKYLREMEMNKHKSALVDKYIEKGRFGKNVSSAKREKAKLDREIAAQERVYHNWDIGDE